MQNSFDSNVSNLTIQCSIAKHSFIVGPVELYFYLQLLRQPAIQPTSQPTMMIRTILRLEDYDQLVKAAAAAIYSQNPHKFLTNIQLAGLYFVFRNSSLCICILYFTFCIHILSIWEEQKRVKSVNSRWIRPLALRFAETPPPPIGCACKFTCG